MKNLLGGDESNRKSRTVEILSDAAYIILTSDSKLTTGENFMVIYLSGLKMIYRMMKSLLASWERT